MVCVCLMACEARYLMCVCLCVSTSVAVLHKIYTRSVPEMSWCVNLCMSRCVYVYMCVAILPFKAVSADVLLCRLMADYDIKCL